MWAFLISLKFKSKGVLIMKKNNNKIYIYNDTTSERDYIIAIKWCMNTMFNIASFKTMEQFEMFAKTLGFKIIHTEIINKGTTHEMKICTSNYKIIDEHFMRLDDLPARAKPIKALSNGSIVTCYYYKDYKANTITIYRPNPNRKDIYKPLELQEHINHKKIYGTY